MTCVGAGPVGTPLSFHRGGIGDKKVGEVFRLHVVSHVRPRSVPKVLTKIAVVVACAFRVLLNVLVQVLRLRNA